MLLNVIYLLPVLALFLRAIVSADARWKRVGAAALALVALIAPA